LFDRVPAIDEIIVVVREGMQSAFVEMAEQLALTKPYRLVAGGRERQDSVWNGLQALSPQSEIVAIQDGARPCASVALIEATIAAARAHGAAVAAQPVTDTIKTSENKITIAEHLDRSRLWAVQTPQTFQVNIIRRALEAVRAKGKQVTDDTAACAEIGQAVHFVNVPGPNPKVTVPEDVPYVEMLLRLLANPAKGP
jgi:2-C-methyl-D-erythritol 4-phosphate cytidylyltransferase